MIGTLLGHYRILRLVGKGGMGEVYAARDETLGREVAIKVLPADLNARPEDLERFAREAKTIASLNHRAIVTLHSFEEAGGVHFITMELVEGEPLASRIPGQGLPFGDLLSVGTEITEAVSVAHDRGIVHRDLKPANVLVRPDGQIKVLDFGLAKLRLPDSTPGDLPTQQLTGEGRIVGTVAYMSPEQAEGRAVDHRSDIFSLGVMLYELATGQRPFRGDTSMSILSAVIREQPRSASDLNPALPSAFARVIKTCLQKDPERRYQSAKDLRNELRTLKEELDSGELMAVPAAARAAAPARRWPLVAGGLGVAAVVIAAAILWPRGSSGTPAALVLQHTQLTSAKGEELEPTLSPDGKWFLYVSTAAGNPDIYLQSVGGQTTLNLTKDSPVADGQPAFSPDGERIAFRSARDGGGLFVMGRTGEAPRRVAPEGFDPHWSPDGLKLVYATASSPLPTSRGGLSALRIVSVDTGAVTNLTDLDAMHPAWSPNGRFVAFWGIGRRVGGNNMSTARDLYVVSASGGEPWHVTDDPYVDWAPVWSPDGALLYFASTRGGSMNLWRLPMDPATGKSLGSPESATTPSAYVGRPRISGGRLVFEARVLTSNIHRAPFDAARATIGDAEPLTSGSRAFRWVDPSPDGQLLVIGTGYLQQEDLFISKVDGSEPRQLTTDAFNDRFPQWSPRGDVIAFYSDRSGKYEIWTTTPAGQLKQLTDAREYSPLYPRWSPDGSRMTFTDTTQQGAVVIFDPTKPWREQQPDRIPPPDGAGTYFDFVTIWSPDGKQLASRTVKTAAVAVYDIASRTYHKVGDVRGIVTAWLKDGRLLVAVSPTDLRLVDPATGSSRPVAMPRLSGLTPQELRLSRDERLAYFNVGSQDTDVWMVTLQPDQANARK